MRIIIIIIIILLLTAIGLSPGGSGYSTFTQNTKLVTTKFKSGGLNEKHVVAIIIIIISESEAPNTVRRRDIAATDRQTDKQTPAFTTEAVFF